MKLFSIVAALMLSLCVSLNAAFMDTSSYDVTRTNPLAEDCGGYTIELLTPGEFDLGSVACDVFSLDTINSTSTILIFNGGNVLGIGQQVNFQFDVIAPVSNQMSDTLRYTAIAVPEPAIMSMLAIGAMGVIRRRSGK